jgi:hypothetical protein
MFEHDLFEEHPFENIPLDRDIFLMDEKWLQDYEKSLLISISGGEGENVGYVSYVAARAINQDVIELSWYPNINDRFHEMRVTLPRSDFVFCVECWQYSEKPRIFVRSDWLTNLHLRAHSVFALVDVIGVKAALERGKLPRSKLIALRDEIDGIAARNPSVAFISFADSLLLKSNWFVGQWDSEINYTYEPEAIIQLLPEIQAIYRKELEMEIYMVIAQGTNEYFEDDLLHISGNHVSLNSLGLPFAQIMAIDNAARSAIHDGMHEPAEVYMDEHFYHSLQFKFEFDKNSRPKHIYDAPMASGPNHYFFEATDTLLNNFLPPKDRG